MRSVANTPDESRVFIIVIIYKPAVHIIGCAVVTARRTNGTKDERREGRIGVRAVAPGCSPMDSRTVVGDRSRCIARAMRRIALLWCTSAIRSVTRARRSAPSISLSFPPSVSRVSRGCPQIARNYWLLLFSRHTPHGSPPFHVISTCPCDALLPHTLVCRFSSFFSLAIPPLAPLLSLTTPPRLLPPWTCS